MVNHSKTGADQWLEGGRGTQPGPVMASLTKMPLTPKRLTPRAGKLWRETGKLLIQAGMLARADLGLLERYAALRAEHEAVMAELASRPRDFEDAGQTAMRAFAMKASGELRQIEDALGLNPVARTRLGKHQPATPEADKLNALRAARASMTKIGEE